jgi:hypothetical protein
MPGSKYFPQSGCERPPCPKCGAKMFLARIEPEKLDHDTRCCGTLYGALGVGMPLAFNSPAMARYLQRGGHNEALLRR